MQNLPSLNQLLFVIQARAPSEDSETMPNAITTFDSSRHHIYIEFYVTDPSGVRRALVGVVDTGASTTEFSDQFLDHAGFIDFPASSVVIKPNQETQKYAKIVLPRVEICGNLLTDFKAHISRFESHWGFDALIGLDFFKKFRVTIDYQKGQLITEAYQ